MTDPNRLTELMHLDVDGRATPAERDELRTALARDPRAREDYRRLFEVVQALNRLPAVDPPGRLRAEILSRLGAELTGRRRQSRGGRRSAAAWLPFGYAVAAGLLIGIVGTLWAAGHPLLSGSPDQAAATMAPVPAGAQVLPIAGPGISGTGSVQANGDATRVAIEFEADGPVEVELRVVRDGRTVYSGTLPER